ncbi:hypothetical protein B0H11DRAFT_1978587 [Mycena galericulata]|nr:hypothetical protein B0H11DRAFT_1978587 [Mycena galericulata]
MDQFLPAYIVAGSAAFIIGHWISTRLRQGIALAPKEYPLNVGQTNAFEIAKLFACITLVFLELVIATRTGVGTWENVALCISYAYAALLACFRLLSPSYAVSSVHLNAVLLVSFITYVYRDLWPLATFTLAPQDLAQGWLLWAKVLVLAVAAIFLPLSSPRPYIPVDPEVANFQRPVHVPQLTTDA